MSVGTNCLWGVNSEGRVVVRLGLSQDTPAGREWVTVDGEPMKQVGFISSKLHTLFHYIYFTLLIKRFQLALLAMFGV